MIKIATKKSPVAVVLDAGTDAGFAAARALLADGYRVVVTARKAGALVGITHGFSADQIYAVAADTDDQRQMDELLARASARLGRVDIIVDPRLHSTVLPLTA